MNRGSIRIPGGIRLPGLLMFGDIILAILNGKRKRHLKGQFGILGLYISITKYATTT